MISFSPCCSQPIPWPSQIMAITLPCIDGKWQAAETQAPGVPCMRRAKLTTMPWCEMASCRGTSNQPSLSNYPCSIQHRVTKENSSHTVRVVVRSLQRNLVSSHYAEPPYPVYKKTAALVCDLSPNTEKPIDPLPRITELSPTRSNKVAIPADLRTRFSFPKLIHSHTVNFISHPSELWITQFFFLNSYKFKCYFIMMIVCWAWLSVWLFDAIKRPYLRKIPSSRTTLWQVLRMLARTKASLTDPLIILILWMIAYSRAWIGDHCIVECIAVVNLIDFLDLHIVILNALISVCI
jgi:hypothetical protein